MAVEIDCFSHHRGAVPPLGGAEAPASPSLPPPMEVTNVPRIFWPYFYTEGRSEDTSSIFRLVYRSYGSNVKALLLHINMSKGKGIKQHNQSGEVFHRDLSLCGSWRFFLVRLTSGFHESHWWFTFPCISVYVSLNQSLIQVSNPQNHKFFFFFFTFVGFFWGFLEVFSGYFTSHTSTACLSVSRYM